MDIPTTGRSIIAVGLPDCARKCVDVDAAGARTCASNTASEPDRINLETPRTAMLLAAGRGERMRPLTDSLPKPLLEAGGYPLLHYPLQALAVAGVDKVVINLAWQGGKIREWLGSGEDYGLRIFFSEEGEQALETGGGIYRALPLLGDAPFWLVNGDVYCDFPFTAGRLAADDLAHLVMVDNPAHHRGGDFCLRQGRVREEGGEKLTYSGLAILRPELFAASRAGVFPLAPLLMEALRADQVSGECYAGEWTDVGTPQRLAELDQRLRGKT